MFHLTQLQKKKLHHLQDLESRYWKLLKNNVFCYNILNFDFTLPISAYASNI